MSVGPYRPPQFLAEELKPHVQGRGDEQLLFTAPQGGPLRVRNFRQRFFAPAVVKAGLGHFKVTPHKLRHTAASLAIASGADINVVQHGAAARRGAASGPCRPIGGRPPPQPGATL